MQSGHVFFATSTGFQSICIFAHHMFYSPKLSNWSTKNIVCSAACTTYYFIQTVSGGFLRVCFIAVINTACDGLKVIKFPYLSGSKPV
jgi:hypothetical protein